MDLRGDIDRQRNRVGANGLEFISCSDPLARLWLGSDAELTSWFQAELDHRFPTIGASALIDADVKVATVVLDRAGRLGLPLLPLLPLLSLLPIAVGTLVYSLAPATLDRRGEPKIRISVFRRKKCGVKDNFLDFPLFARIFEGKMNSLIGQFEWFILAFELKVFPKIWA